MHTRCRSLHLSIVGAPSRAVAHNTAKLKGAKQQNIRCIASSLKFLWYGSMEWNMEENFSMEWKIFSMEWKKIARMEYGKIVFHSIPYHALINIADQYFFVVKIPVLRIKLQKCTYYV